jgi:hypothetical protein
MSTDEKAKEMPESFKKLVSLGIPKEIAVKVYLELEANIAYNPGEVAPIRRLFGEPIGMHQKGNSGIDTW